MLSKAAIAYLSSLTYRANAERRICVLPLGGIYWADEIPDFKTLLKISKPDQTLIYRLFSIRFKVWNEEILSSADQEFWDAARLLIPACPLFKRLRLSDDDRRAQDQVEQDAIEGFEALLAEADEVKVVENEQCSKTFSITFDLTKNQAVAAKTRPWWKRLWSRA